MPKVSIVIPSYNMAHYLSDAVESAVGQSYRDFEVIVIDDGSTDNTRDIARKYLPKVRYYYQENQGLSSARNRGIEMAEGEYIVFLDADDILFDDALRKNVTFLDQHPEVGFCYGRVYKMNENGHLMRIRRLRGARNSCVREGKEQIARILFRGDISPSATMVRHSCLKEVGLFDIECRFGEDIDMWVRLANRYEVGYLAEPICKYRVHAQSMTGQRDLKYLENSQTNFIQLTLQNLESEPHYKHIRRKTYFGLYCYLGEENARDGHYIACLRYVLKAIRAYPALLLHKDGISFMVSVARSLLPEWSRKLVKRMLINTGLKH